MQEDWLGQLTVPLQKKRCTQDYDNYRGYSLAQQPREGLLQGHPEEASREGRTFAEGESVWFLQGMGMH